MFEHFKFIVTVVFIFLSMDLKFNNLLKAVEELRNRMDNKSRDYNNLKHCFDELKSRYEKTDKHCVIGDNDREQYSRNWCLRFFGIFVCQEDIDEFGLDIACMIAVYNRIVKPVLSKASKKVLPEIPPWYVLFENGHFVGQAVQSKKNPAITLPRTVIIRFSLRWQRNLFLKLKKQHMPEPTDAEHIKGIEYFSASPDLTKLNYSVKQRLYADKRVHKVWSLDGRLRFTMGDDNFVFKVECVLDTNDQIICSALKQKTKSRDFSYSNSRPLPKPVVRLLHVAQPGTAQPSAVQPISQPPDSVETEIKKTSPVPAQSVAGKSGNDLSGRRRQHAILLSGPSPAVLAEREKHGFVSKISQDSDLNVDVLDSIIQ